MPLDPKLKDAAEVALMALTVWREARGELRPGKAAVAWSIAARARKEGWWGHDVLSVLCMPYQYSSLTDPRDRQLTRWPTFDAAFEECLEVCRAVLDGTEPNLFPDADSYHDTSITPPKWATPVSYRGQTGRLKFYCVLPDRRKKETPNA